MKIKLPPVVDKFVGILRAEEGPDVLPASIPLLGAGLCVYVIVQFMTALHTHSFPRAAEIGLVTGVLLVVVAAALAYSFGYSERLTQTLTALAAAGAVVSLVNLVFRFALRTAFIGMDMEALPIDDIANFILFPLFLWNVIVFVSIFRRAFRIGIILCFVLAFGYSLAVTFWIPRLLY